MEYFKESNKSKSILLLFLAGVALLLMGCKLFSVDFWINRSDTGENRVPTESTDTGKETQTNDDAQSFGARCLESLGDAPCPLDACVVATDLFSAKYEITSELYGKANPDNFSCCAGYKFINNSGAEVMVFEHLVSDGVDGWFTKLYSTINLNDTCSNYYGQNDGVISYWEGITEVIVIYANPHCDWIDINEPKIMDYSMPVTGLCAP